MTKQFAKEIAVLGSLARKDTLLNFIPFVTHLRGAEGEK